MALSKSLLPLLAALPSASCWGGLGHTAVAYIAQNFVADSTAQFAQNLLGDSSSDYLANVATWADEYRYTSEGRFSAPYHFLDAMDNPPSSCNVDYERDCPDEGCIVSAIANYSSRAFDTTLSQDEQIKAFKWIVHFVGDIHQPLHVENLDIGGNTIKTTFNGVDTNLHATWDTQIPQQAEGSNTHAHASTWANQLTTAIQSGAYHSEASSWLQNINASAPVNTAMVWAADSNQFVCSTVMPNGPDALAGQDLSGGYASGVLPVVQKQIAKAGYRLAAWLDAIVAQAQSGQRVRFVRERRGDVKLEPWMVEARARRRAADGCGCEGLAHAH